MTMEENKTKFLEDAFKNMKVWGRVTQKGVKGDSG